MGNSALDVPALLVGVAVAAVIAAVLWAALRTHEPRRGWLAAGALFVVLSAAGVVDLMRAPYQETLYATVLIGIGLPVLGALGVLRGTRRLGAWLRVLLAFVTALLLLFAGFLLGAVLARWLPF